jgi:hypothetical protein
MKGSEALTDTLMIISGIILIFALILTILPKFLDFLKTAALDSAGLVSKELAELVTVSAAAPFEIQITYNPSNSKYNLDIKDRLVKTELTRETSSVQSAKENLQTETAFAKIAIDVISSFERVNVFDIRKDQTGTSVQAS